MNNNSKAFNFKPEDDDFRPLSKESVSQTQTSSPFDKGSIETDPKVYEFLDGLKLSKYWQLFSDLTTILDLDDESLSELQIPLGKYITTSKLPYHS
jgi:hypothetical protein